MTSSASTRTFSPFLPLLGFGLSLVLFFGWQVNNTRQQREQLEQAISQREEAVQQADQQRGALLSLARQVIELAPGDAAAKAVVKKYQISLTNPDAPAVHPSPEAASSPSLSPAE
ncbi:MAG TPA: hypothetical protein VNQ90_18775 [Chthoniobacteraceae bacterium]|nr:hypothetical protein [Chthoniobacteraceae bacterium]